MCIVVLAPATKNTTKYIFFIFISLRSVSCFVHARVPTLFLCNNAKSQNFSCSSKETAHVTHFSGGGKLSTSSLYILPHSCNICWSQPSLFLLQDNTSLSYDYFPSLYRMKKRKGGSKQNVKIVAFFKMKRDFLYIKFRTLLPSRSFFFQTFSLASSSRSIWSDGSSSYDSTQSSNWDNATYKNGPKSE